MHRLFLGKLHKLSKAIKIFLNYFLGPLLFIWIVVSISRQLRAQENLETALHQIRLAFTGPQLGKIGLVVLLMPINWGLETLKWYVLINREYKLSFLKALQSVLSGVTLAMHTPNRIGEYGGRVLYLDAPYRLKGIVLNWVASLSQLVITLFMGVAAIWMLRQPLIGASNTTWPDVAAWYWWALGIIAVPAVLATVLYFRLKWLVHWAQRIAFVQKKMQWINTLENLPLGICLQVLLYSLLRFGVFALQYVWLWQALGVDISLYEGFWGVALIFVIMAIVPTVALVELGLRGKVALAIMGLFSINSAAILTGTIGIWLLNLIIPSLAGSLMLLTIKFFREK